MRWLIPHLLTTACRQNHSPSSPKRRVSSTITRTSVSSSTHRVSPMHTSSRYVPKCGACVSRNLPATSTNIREPSPPMLRAQYSTSQTSNANQPHVSTVRVPSNSNRPTCSKHYAPSFSGATSHLLTSTPSSMPLATSPTGTSSHLRPTTKYVTYTEHPTSSSELPRSPHSTPTNPSTEHPFSSPSTNKTDYAKNIAEKKEKENRKQEKKKEQNNKKAPDPTKGREAFVILIANRPQIRTIHSCATARVQSIQTYPYNPYNPCSETTTANHQPPPTIKGFEPVAPCKGCSQIPRIRTQNRKKPCHPTNPCSSKKPSSRQPMLHPANPPRSVP